MRHNSRTAAALASLAALALVIGAAKLPAADDGAELQLRERAAAPARPAESPAVQPPGEAAATVLDRQDVQGILGRQVLSSAGEDMGRVIDVVVDRNGQVRAAVIDFGGFLGVGNRKVAIDWSALRFSPTGGNYERITLDLTRDQVKAVPEYKDGRPLVWSAPPRVCNRRYHPTDDRPAAPERGADCPSPRWSLATQPARARLVRLFSRRCVDRLRSIRCGLLLEQNIDIRVIQVLLGHAKLETTALYTQVASKTIREVMSPLDRLTPLRIKTVEPKHTPPA